MSNIDNVFIQVRGRLNLLSIKLWTYPYFIDDMGSNESEMQRLAEDFSTNLGLSISNCRLALNELQEGAIRKLEARKDFAETGIATFTVRRVSNHRGTENISSVKCSLSETGADLQKIIAGTFNMDNVGRIKLIASGKIIHPEQTLESQGLKNNQQLMAIISDIDEESGTSDAMYDRIRRIKLDVERLVDSDRQHFEMEDQDGNAIFMPPAENRAILTALSYYEKARMAMKRNQYDEALILLLEADEKFRNCNSSFLESVDNYALVNLDIVWCYLCLKNVSQLPDAERRLQICEKSFERSYGKDLERLIALRGRTCPERALILRLKLLQGVIYFHQNQRNAAYEMLEKATNELNILKVDDGLLTQMVEMGFEPYEARLGLRASAGVIEGAITFIQNRRAQVEESRQRSIKERRINHRMRMTKKGHDKNWVNPRSVCTLMEMGYSCNLAIEALKRSKNDIPTALELLQNQEEELRRTMKTSEPVNENLLKQLLNLDFPEPTARVALQTAHNNIDKAIDLLVSMFESEEELQKKIKHFNISNSSESTAAEENNGASTSGASNRLPNLSASATSILDLTSELTGTNSASGTVPSTSLKHRLRRKLKDEIESFKAYERFNEDMPDNDQDYLDLPLIQEEQIIAEYKRLLEQ